MLNQNTYNLNQVELVSAKLADLAQLVKMRLTLLVVFSSAMGYLYASELAINPIQIIALLVGGFLITGSSNALNQVYEKRIDSIMKRTENRPVASGRMSATEGAIWGMLMGAVGVIILIEFTNELCAMFATLSLILYAFLYTPLKRISRISVYVGAIPGAMPFLLGWVAFTAQFNLEAGLLFLIQFIWQLPHTWSIAWLLKSDYQKVGIQMMPTNWKNPKLDAFITLLSAVVLLAACIVPFVFGFIGVIGLVITMTLGIYFIFKTWNLFKTCEMSQAKAVLIGSILFLPLVQIGYVIDKIVL